MIQINEHVSRDDSGRTFYDGEELTPKVCDDGRTLWFDIDSKIKYTDLPSQTAGDMGRISRKNYKANIQEDINNLLNEFGLNSPSAIVLAGTAVAGGSPGVGAIRELYKQSKLNSTVGGSQKPGEFENCPLCGRSPLSPGSEFLNNLILAIKTVKDNREREPG